jgi:hypothetical protein
MVSPRNILSILAAYLGAIGLVGASTITVFGYLDSVPFPTGRLVIVASIALSLIVLASLGPRGRALGVHALAAGVALPLIGFGWVVFSSAIQNDDWPVALAAATAGILGIIAAWIARRADRRAFQVQS